MLAKLIISLLLITAVVSYPIDGVEDDDDIPVYTEKVSAAKPTTRVPRFESKKLATPPKKAPESSHLVKESPYHAPEQPKIALKTTKPIRPNVRPVRRSPEHPQNTIVEDTYPKRKPVLRGGYNAPQPSYAAAPQLGVEYAPEVVANSYEESPVHSVEVQPVRIAKPIVPEYGGNAHYQNYQVAPQAVSAPSSGYKPDYYPYIFDYEFKDVNGATQGRKEEDKPQPYIFGYEFKDVNGATQSRKEQGDDYGNKRGSYGYTDEHGIYRQVDYVADAHGFRAVIKTNEPGTDNQNPADVEIHSEAAKY
ncbi:cuticle protein 16.8 [Caerostris darwini]|uniref:Cuticle protein 16.8 n=1 Tax=Caerostris darwini TaxID=1538125 RepID=A0AAV4NCL4_9ARAC|nr:cuticle protein 16.8 [Caerostris darwini]